MTDFSRRQFVAGGLGLGAALAGYPDSTPRTRSASAWATETVVESDEELEAAFENLTEGDTIRISAENAPYRTTCWLDVDTDGVTVVGPGIEHLIVPADGANVGGIRIGHNERCREIDVRWVGYHGNPAGQDPGAKQRHGIIVRKGSNVTLRNNYVTRTHPYHVHNAGGSGISVEQESSNVRVLNNRIYDIGDRGIQLAGDGIQVVGNVVTDGFDRGISFDVPVAGKGGYRPRNVVVTRNVIGNNAEGSLVGGGGSPRRSDRGYFIVTNNVGFGHHKHLCHLGFDGRISDVQITDNVGTQAASNQLAGVSVDISRATNIAIRNNALHDYSGRGINVAGDITDFVVAGNSINDPDGVGVRVAGASDGTVANNHIDGAGRAGVVLHEAGYVTVDRNRIRRVGGAAIVTRNAPASTRNVISNNHVRGYDRSGDGVLAAVVVHDSHNTVRHNHVHRNETPAIVEGPAADANRYESNWADGRAPWKITGPASVARGNSPPLDAHRGRTPDASGTVRLRFDKPYATPPKVTFGRRERGVETVSFVTDERGNYTGAEISLRDGDGVVDVFVDPVE